jgi:cytochrome c5
VNPQKLFVLMFISIGVLGLALAAIAINVAAPEPEPADPKVVAERIAPVGKTCMAGEACAGTATTAAAGGGKSGKSIYETYCVSCHSAGVLGAPKFGVAVDWKARLAKGVESLYSNAINGINAMPAKGVCADCSDAEIKATVDYMLENNK